MKKIIEEIRTSDKKYFRVYSQIGIDLNNLIFVSTSKPKGKAIDTVKKFYRALYSKMIDGEMPESYLTVYAYNEKHSYYESAPMFEYRFKQN
jgi:hypothetical protein